MTYRIIRDKQEIATAQEFLQKIFKSVSEPRQCNVGHQGESGEQTVYWSEQLKIWGLFEETGWGGNWNGFGTSEPISGNSCVGITCEINVPREGINPRAAGAFVKDSEDSTYLVHSGKIGGGRSGVGKALFVEEYGGEWITLDNGDKVAKVGKLDNSLPSKIAEFVKEVGRMKQHV